MSRILARLVIVFLAVTACFDVIVSREQQFSYLAEAFLHGQTYFLDSHKDSLPDIALFNGRQYWPLGPFPAVILIPFVFIFRRLNLFFYQGYLQFFLVLGIFYLCTRIARKLDYSSEDSRFLAYGFCFSTAFVGTAMWPWSWYFAHVVTVLLLFLIIWEYLGRGRPLVIGTLSAALLLTRVSASLIILFFVLQIVLDSRDSAKSVTISLTQLLTPFALGLVCLFVYNFNRFENIFETGYSMQIVPEHAIRARSYGIFSPSHVPGNLYYLFVASALPVFRDGTSSVLQFPFLRANDWGMSIFVTSPMFLSLFLLDYGDRCSKLILTTVVIISTPILFYYGVGWKQFGFRYSLDFLPLLFFLLMRNYHQKYKKLSSRFKILILLTSLSNFYLFLTAIVP